MIGKLLALVRSRTVVYGLLLVVVLALLAFMFFKLWRTADERADKAEDVLASRNVVRQIVKEYVREIEYRPVPESVIAARVDRLCEQRRHDRPDPDGAAPADADHRRNRDFDRELVAAWRNARQLEALQAAARAAGCAE